MKLGYDQKKYDAKKQLQIHPLQTCLISIRNHKPNWHVRCVFGSALDEREK